MERVQWSDEDDLPLPPQKKRKTRPVAAPKKKVAMKGSMVGIRKTKPTRKPRNISASDTDEDTLPDQALPKYLEARRRTRDEAGTEGALLPPNYDDIDFPQDLRTLVEKPDLSDIEPPRPYEDTYIGWKTAIIPAPIVQYLKPYQVEGAEFLYKRFLFQKGGILGDDMGLGKTIQVIAFLTAAFGKTGDERDDKRMRKVRRMDNDRWYPRILLICPGGLMANWQSELDTWGWWHTYLFHGSVADKEAALRAAENGLLEIMITTYDSYRNSEADINSIRWDCVIADECHKIKEPKAMITKAMNNVNALCRLGLSGTSIQNKYEELWTLLNWCSPGELGTLAVWKSTICLPLKLGQSHDATVSQLSKARRIATKLVSHLLPQFFLRRTKALIAHQLPKKSDRVVFCPLTETQTEAYNNFCDHELVHAIRDSTNPCYCGSGKKQGWCCVEEVEEFGRWRLHAFPVLWTLQALAGHIGLLVPSDGEGDKHDKALQKLKIAMPDSWPKLYKNRDNLLQYANTEFCGKWKVLKKLLKLWHANGDKVLIFSYKVRFLTMIRTLLSNTEYSITYLDGSMSLDDRKVAVDEYNSDPSRFVFLISTKAGGVGLNITSANKVVILDPNWNPAYDLQAQDRAYRIGQTRPVEVFRLVSAGTIEEIVYARQIYKQQQANIGYNASVERRYFKGVQDQKDQKGEIFGLANLFAPVKENVVLRDIVNKTNIAETRAGVEIGGLDFEPSEEDEDMFFQGEDAAMSQLAQEIIDEPGARRKAAKETAKKKDPVQAILASAGVEYTHENAEVIGTSKIETKISSRAQKAGNDVDHINELAFARGTESQSSQQQPDPGYVYKQDRNEGPGEDDAVDLDDGLGKVRYKYRPPLEVRKRQFCTMAEELGYDDVMEFALVVEGWTQEERRNCLEKFYLKRRAKLAGQRA